MDKDIGRSIKSLKNELNNLEDKVREAKRESDQGLSEFHNLLADHIERLTLQLRQEQLPKPGSFEFEELDQANAQLVGGFISEVERLNEAIKSVTNLANTAIRTANDAASSAKKAVKDAEKTIVTAEKKVANALGSELTKTINNLVRALGALYSEAATDVAKVETLVDAAVLQTLHIAGKVPGSINSLDPIIKNAEDTIRKKIQEAINDKDSPLYNLVEILHVLHTLSELGHDLVERIEIVIHSMEDLAEDALQPVIKILRAIQDLFEGEKEEVPEKLVELLVLVIITTNPIAAAVEALFVGKKKSLGELLTPGLPKTGILYEWMTEVSDVTDLNKKGKLVPPTPERREQELAFRRMVVGAVDTYIRTGHTGIKVGLPKMAGNGKKAATNGTSESGDSPGGTIRAVDLRPLVASGVELASVLSGALLSYLFMPSGVPNPAVPKFPHRISSIPHPFDFRADMAASFARTVTQPVMSIAAVVLNGFWEVSPNNRALVNALSGYLGHLIRSLFEHLISGILHLFEVHEVYPDDQKAPDGYIPITDWDSWNIIPDHNTNLKFVVYLDLHVAYPFIAKDKNVKAEFERLTGLLQDLIKKESTPDSFLLGLLKDYIGYREAVMDYRGPRPDASEVEITDFKTKLDSGKENVQLTVKLDEETINGPSVPVVRVFAGDSVPVVLISNNNGKNTYTGNLKVPPVSKLTKRLRVHARTNYGGMKSADVNFK